MLHTTTRKPRRRIVGLGSVLLAVALGALLLLGGLGHSYRTKKAFTPFFLPVYEIEAEFNKLIEGLCASGATSAAA